MKESVAVAKEADKEKEFSSSKSDNNSIHRVQDAPARQLGSLGGVIGDIRSNGGKPSVESVATQLSGMHFAERAPALLALQQTHGNQYVQRVVSGIQAKLVVGQPGDVYEQEADRVADAVMRMPEPEVHRQVEEEEEEELIQTKPLAEEITSLVQRQVEEEEEEELQAKELSSQTSEISPNLESRINATKGGGQPLPESDRAFFEPRFGYNFSQVRVHADAQSAETSHAINARAFTLGNDVAFGAGEYAPETVAGKRLLAHELTHVVQQQGSRVQRRLPVSQPGDRHEDEADRIANRPLMQLQRHYGNRYVQRAVALASQGKEVEIQSKSTIQRQPVEGEDKETLQMSTMVQHSANANIWAKALPIRNAVRFGTIQLSPLSDELRRVWLLEGPEALFGRLRSLEASDIDVVQFVEQELPVAERRIAKRILYSGGILQFTDSERLAQKVMIGHDMQTAHSDFDGGAAMAEQDIAAAARARADIAKAIFSIGMTIIVPGFGGVVAGAATRFGATIASATANIIGSAIGDAAKTAGNSAIDTAFGRQTRSFFTAITSGFEAAQRRKLQWIVQNTVTRQDRCALPDDVLFDLGSYWEQIASHEATDWAGWFQEQWTRYERQVLAIQPPTRTPVVHPPPEHIREVQTGLIWAERPDGTEYLVQITATTRETGGHRGPSRLAFQTFIDQDLRDLAIARARRTQPRGIQTISWGFIVDIPSTVPRSAVRR